MKVCRCEISGKSFVVSDEEISLRRKFGFDDFPHTAPEIRLRHRGAFWQHWNLHRRKCDKTGESMISVYSEKCPYPVWHKDEWMKHAEPPSRHFDEMKSGFEQMWELFQKCPIPHNVGTGTQNCEYTDDWWYGKNCYLCHSGVDNEDLRYCYRTIKARDSQFCVFTFTSELCADLINCSQCFEVVYGLHCRNCQNSAFLYDCRDCKDCLFCFNLRSKQYCFGNKQLTKEEFEIEKKKWNTSSRKTYDKAKEYFAQMMHTHAWHRAVYVDKCQDSVGSFLENCKNAKDCFFIAHIEDSVNCLRGDYELRTCLDALGLFRSELLFSTSQVQDRCYDCKLSYNLTQCRAMEYSACCFQCQHCFGCCGLRRKRYCIFNKEYSKEEYEKLRSQIVKKMEKEKEWGEFFPGYFAPNPYEESWSGFYFPLSREEQKKFDFREKEEFEKEKKQYLPASSIPDSSQNIPKDILKKVFWDEKAKRPFQILKEDIEFSRTLKIPLTNQHYIERLQENFRWMPFDGTLRETTCAKSGTKIKTTWGKEFDGRILSEEEYLKVVK
jgi:hypothetical protein